MRSNARVIPLVRDLDVSLVPAEAAVGGWDVAELRRLFEFLEFRTLWDRFVDATGTGKADAGAVPATGEPLAVAVEPWRGRRRSPVPSGSGPVAAPPWL